MRAHTTKEKKFMKTKTFYILNGHQHSEKMFYRIKRKYLQIMYMMKTYYMEYINNLYNKSNKKNNLIKTSTWKGARHQSSIGYANQNHNEISLHIPYDG
jgi:hypothetical protein